VEAVAVAVTLVSVWLTAEGHVLCWPAGIVGGLLYTYIFGRARLYSDVLLQIYFVVTSVYGWYAWTHGGPGGGALGVTRLSLPAAAAWATISITGAAGLGGVMRRCTRAALPYWDAAIAVMSLVAQYLLTRKVLESWILWVAVDAIAVGVYASRRLFLTAALYGVLLALAAKGLWTWMDAIR
jgi:nicotinamide mononucleotide transporter